MSLRENDIIRVSSHPSDSSLCPEVQWLGMTKESVNSPSSSIAPCCRICHGSSSQERLISPCQCKGSLGYVHKSCLEQWLNRAGRRHCELCLQRYNAVQSRRYRCCESARVWMRHPANRSHVQADILICSLLTIVTVGLLVVCLFGMRYFVLEGLKLGITQSWTQGAIVIFLSIVTFGYAITLYLLIKDQVFPWYAWWRTATEMRLVVSEEETTSV